jgi:hypothetical protein
MSKLTFILAFAGLSLGGCYIETTTTDGTGGHGSGGHGSGGVSCSQPASDCASHADCLSSEACSAGKCSATNTPPSCTVDSDCPSGSQCDASSGHCVASPTTCADLANEATCSARADCMPIYAGVDCSCGPDCTCQGGEPGCVCQSFEFFRCEDAAG